MRTHITHVLSSCYSTLRHIRSIMPSLSSLLWFTPGWTTETLFSPPFQRLQSVLITAVRLVADSSRCDHAFSLLRDRHWLPVKQRVEYRLCMTVHGCLYGDAPSYLLDLITSSADATVRAGLRSAASSTVAVPRTMSSFADRSFAVAGPSRMEQTATTALSRSFCCCF